MLIKSFFSIHFYLIEIIYRLIYFIISFVCSVIISFFYMESLLLLETYPFLKFSSKKFIVTHTTDLLDVVWILSLSTALIIVFPLFFYQIIQFSKISWYNYQIKFLKKLFITSVSIYYFSLFFCYQNLLPVILNFLSQWEIKQKTSILNIEIEFRILTYIKWILMFRYCFGILIYLCTLLILQSVFLFHITKFYNIMKIYRRQICFLNITFLFLLLPPDVFLQFFTIFTIFIFYEIIFFFICYKISNNNLKLNY